jgi:hypothetical protein
MLGGPQSRSRRVRKILTQPGSDPRTVQPVASRYNEYALPAPYAVVSLLQPSGNYMYHQINQKNSTFCPHSVFMCFVWIWEHTAIISLYSINWLVFIIEKECLLHGMDWNFVQISF